MSIGAKYRPLLVNADVDVPNNVSHSNANPDTVATLTVPATSKFPKFTVQSSSATYASSTEESDLEEHHLTTQPSYNRRNFDILQHQWTRVKAHWNPMQYIRNASKLKQSNRTKTVDFTTRNIVCDTIQHGWCQVPQHNYNPFVRISLIRATVSSDDKACKGNSESIDLRNTFPIYNGGNDVRFTKFDRNTHIFSLNHNEWMTSWLSFEVWDDRILTGHDTRLGDVCMDLGDLKDEGQMYYTQLPIINKENASNKPEWMKDDLDDEDQDGKSGYLRIATDDVDEQKELESHDAVSEHINMMGVIHVTAIKKIKQASAEDSFDNMRDVFGENKHECFDLEIEILALTTLKPLPKKQGMDDRKFKLGIIGFILYLLFYAAIMYVAELHTSTGMNEYKESIWFALITVSTLGYGDITAQTPWSKVLNSFFIAVNVIIIAGFVSNLLGYMVTAGEKALDARLNDTMDGVQHVLKKNQSEIKRIHANKTYKSRHAPSQSLPQAEIQKITNSMTSHHRMNSLPVLHSRGVADLKAENVSRILTEEEKEELRSAEVATTKATKIKLEQLDNISDADRAKFRVQLYVNFGLFLVTLLFGFFTLGVAELLTGPNFLTNLPYFGYECTSDYDPHCVLDDNPLSVFTDSLYYSVVSMTTVGYGDIYPQTNALARVLGAVFILIGTMLLVRLVDLLISRMLQNNTTETKKRKLNALLTSSSEYFEFDLDGDGVIDRFEFLVGMLTKLDLVSMDRINEMMIPFHEVDADGNGCVELKELGSKVYEERMKLKWGENAWTEIKQSWDTIKQQQEQMEVVRKRLKEQRNRLKKKEREFRQQKTEWEKQKQEEMKQLRKEFEKLKDKEQKVNIRIE